jgi:hypothetical protein
MMQDYPAVYAKWMEMEMQSNVTLEHWLQGMGRDRLITTIIKKALRETGLNAYLEFLNNRDWVQKTISIDRYHVTLCSSSVVATEKTKKA